MENRFRPDTAIGGGFAGAIAGAIDGASARGTAPRFPSLTLDGTLDLSWPAADRAALAQASRGIKPARAKPRTDHPTYESVGDLIAASALLHPRGHGPVKKRDPKLAPDTAGGRGPKPASGKARGGVKARFKVTGRRTHQGVVKLRTFDCNEPVLPAAARAEHWSFVRAERVS